jgi:benzoyl-CoA reductase subunit C
VLPIEEYLPLIGKAARQVVERDVKPRDSIRVIIEGSFCEQPPLDLIRLIEEAGCYVIDDDLVLGRKWFRADVATTGDPLTALADSYVNNSVCSSVRHDFRRPRHEALVAKALAERADAVIFLIAKFCEPAYFDYVLFKQSLEREGIPHLLLEFEEKTFTFERLRMEVETFAESMLFQ